MTPLISICISTRNRASLLVETLASILEQASESTEIVVLDGASTDDTLARVLEVSLRDSRVRLVESTENGGIDVDYDRAV
ncbi:MAG TPA: glycosyltransferase, partial [Polyangiaceae bacterium]|nr:glycosyltransferase [Polyangiaceae bacterium]